MRVETIDLQAPEQMTQMSEVSSPQAQTAKAETTKAKQKDVQRTTTQAETSSVVAAKCIYLTQLSTLTSSKSIWE